MSDSNMQLLLEYADTKDRNLRNQLVMQNMNLVYHIAHQFKGKYNTLSLGDLIQDGTIGLIRAIETFDINKGTFSSYAYLLIYRTIITALQRDRLIQLPDSLLRKIKKCQEGYQRLLDSLSRVPTVSELSEELNMTKKTIKMIQIYGTEPLELSEAAHYTISEEEGLDRQNSSSLHVSQKDFEQLLHLFGLNQRRIQILCLYFGLFQDQPRTEQEIAQILHMSRANVAQHMSTAIRYIKTSKFRDLIEECMESNNNIPQKIKQLQGQLL